MSHKDESRFASAFWRAGAEAEYEGLTDLLPVRLRNQIFYLIQECLGKTRDGEISFGRLNELICADLGLSTVRQNTRQGLSSSGFHDFMQNNRNVLEVLSGVELAYRYMMARGDLRSAASRFGDELNYRFAQNRVVYQFASGMILRRDSELLFEELTKPVLKLLEAPEYAGPNDEFLRAQNHYRSGDYQDCIHCCGNAFESTMKAVCAIRGWEYKKGEDAAKKLIAVLFANGLVPEYLQTKFAALRTLLESSIPTLRNKAGGHGQGPEVVSVPQSLATYQLNLTASTILYIVSAEQETRSGRVQR